MYTSRPLHLPWLRPTRQLRKRTKITRASRFSIPVAASGDSRPSATLVGSGTPPSQYGRSCLRADAAHTKIDSVMRRLPRYIQLCIFWLLTGCPPLSGTGWACGLEDWPGWRGSERTGISHETGWSWKWGSNAPPVLWRAAVGIGFSSFAAVGGRVYTLGNDGQSDTVFCFEADTGNPLWRHRYPCNPQPLSYEGGPSSTPLVDGGRIFTFSKGGDLVCLNATNGQILWSKKFAPWPQLPGD